MRDPRRGIAKAPINLNHQLPQTTQIQCYPNLKPKRLVTYLLEELLEEFVEDSEESFGINFTETCYRILSMKGELPEKLLVKLPKKMWGSLGKTSGGAS